MRIIFFSNAPFCQTSYGRITRELALRFRDLGHDIAIAANYGLVGNAIDWNGITIYPAVRHRLGFDTIGDYCRHFYTDVVLTLYDVWAFPADIGRIIEPAWIAYTPIDGAPVPPSVVERLTAQRGDPVYTVSMSKFGERELDKAGVDNTYIPLGIDCDVFKPGDKGTARTALSIPQDVFMATMVAANKGLPPRKSWIAAFMAFAHFNKSQPNSVLYAHTTKTPMVKDGIFLDRLAEELGIKERVVFPDECELAVGVPDEQMATIYQASDVLLSPSMGEGFGLPIVEAQACGCKVITQRCSAMTELTFYGESLKPLQPVWITQLDYYWQQASVDKIYVALRVAHEMGHNQGVSEIAIEEVREQYHWPSVIERYWQPFLATVEGELW